MADVYRWRYGDTNPQTFAVDSATVIEIGDIVWLDTDDVKPAASITYGASLAACQEAVHDAFAGVALQRSRAGDTAPIRVATGGVFEFACASASLQNGALVGVDDNAGGDAALNQQVISVATANLAVGRVVKAIASQTAVLVEIVSTTAHGGPQAMI